VQLPLRVVWSGQTALDLDHPQPRMHISQWPGVADLDQQDGARRLRVRVLRTTGTGTSALRRQWLAEPQVVAAGVADGGVTDAVGLVDGLLEDLRPGGTQRLEGLV
jgi:hypothetical protein